MSDQTPNLELTRANIELQALKEKKLAILQTKKKLIEELPHKYGFKRYAWQEIFYSCEAQDAFLTAANQIGKSTINIATAIEWAGNKLLHARLFKRRAPRVFWYFYPTAEIATSEFENKWLPDLMPRGGAKEDPDSPYAWRVNYQGKYVHSIEFYKTGVTIYFKSYSQNVINLQGATVDAVFCDEELPEEYWDELNWRRRAVLGKFRMVFTATLGQKIWYDTMERVGTPEEKFPNAHKQQVSLFDCMKFADGTPSHIDDDYIKTSIELCKSPAEVQKRVYGRFASESGLKYPTYDRKLNSTPARNIPRNWHIYIGVDIGSGGEENHPSSIVFVGVNPEMTKAEVFDGWLGTDRVTTDIDVYDQMMLMIGEAGLEDRITGTFYDYHAKDFGTICERNGWPIEKADKSHDTGEAVLGVLFKTLNLMIQDRGKLEQLCFQLSNLKRDTAKRHAVDDFVDGLRYALTRVPFDWKAIGVQVRTSITNPTNGPKKPEKDLYQIKLDKRREQYMQQMGLGPEAAEQSVTVEDELAFWSSTYDF